MSITIYQAMKEVQELEAVQLTEHEITLLKLRVRFSPPEIAEVLGLNARKVYRDLEKANAKIKEQRG